MVRECVIAEGINYTREAVHLPLTQGPSRLHIILLGSEVVISHHVLSDRH